MYATNVAASDATAGRATEGLAEGEVNNTLYVDDGRLAWDPTQLYSCIAIQCEDKLLLEAARGSAGPDRATDRSFS